MSGHLSVKNFEKFQHYTDRAPPWIKLHGAVLDNYEFGQLPDASKAHLMAIWLLASKLNNHIPNDAKWISRKINATERIDINLLVQSGFLLEHDASAPLAESKQNGVLEESRGETEGEGEGDRASARPRKQASQVPEDWEPNEAGKAFAAEHGLDPRSEVGRFRDHWKSKAIARADWDATWRNWIRNAKDFKQKNGAVPKTNGHAPTGSAGPIDTSGEGSMAALAAENRRRNKLGQPPMIAAEIAAWRASTPPQQPEEAAQ